MLSKFAFLKEKALDNLLDAKKHSDNRQYKYKHEILALMMAKSPKDFYVDSDDGSIVGLTHAPTRFKIHVPKKFVPSKVEKKIMPSKSQNQQKLMNWVHAIQKGKATGPAKVKNIANSMKPDSVEHFMGRGHINKELPVKKAFELGFLTRASELGIDKDKAYRLFKSALDLPQGLDEQEPLIKTPFNPSGGNAPAQLPPPALGGDNKPGMGANPSFNVDVNKPLAQASAPDPNAGTSLNIPQGQPQPLPPSPLGVPQPQAPQQLPPALGQKQLKSAPGTREHAYELYTENGDDSEIRNWAKANPSQATIAAQNSSQAWNQLGEQTTGDKSLEEVQNTGSQLDQRLKGISPMLIGATANNSIEGQNYNNAWADHKAQTQLTNNAYDKAFASNDAYDAAATKQREELRGLRGQQPIQLLGAQPMQNKPATTPPPPNTRSWLDTPIAAPDQKGHNMTFRDLIPWKT